MKLRTLFLIFLAILVAGPSCSRDPKVRSRKYVAVGNKYMQRSKIKEASIMYRKAISVDRANAEAYYRLGLIEMRQNQVFAAEREFRRALDPHLNLTGQMLDDARDKLADIFVNHLSRYGASRDKPREVRAAILQRVVDFQNTYPKSFQAVRLQGYVLRADSTDAKTEEARASLLKQALETFQEANRLKPLQSDVTLNLALILTEMGRFPEAEKLANALIQKEKDYLPTYMFLYIQYVKLNRLDDAENMLKAQVENNPKNAAPILELAAYYFLGKRRPEMVKTLDRLLSNPKDFPDARLKVGDFYLRSREWDEANHQFQEGMRANPKAKSVYQKRIVALLIQQGRVPDAERYLAEILKDNPNDLEARQWHANLLLNSGSSNHVLEAITELRLLVGKSADNPNPVLHYELGHAYFMNAEAAYAEVEFKEAIKIKPDYLPPMRELAQLALLKADFALANQVAGEILKLDPRSVDGRLMRARALAGMGRFNEARADLMEASKVNPNSGNVQFQVGVVQYMERNFKEAEDTFRKLYQTSDYRGLAGLTEAYAAQNQYDRAIQLLQTEITKAPGNSTVRLFLANMSVRAQKYDQAIVQFKALIAQDPKREDLYLRLAETYRRNGDLKGASENFRKARDLAPTDWGVHLQLALLLESMGQKDEAKRMYDKVLKLKPDNPIALNNLAFSMAESGADLDQALTLAQRAKQTWPQNPDVADTLGWIYIKKNLSDSAVAVFRDLVAKQPKRADYRYHYAMALYQKGDKLNAKKELQTALESAPSKEDESKIKELIAKIG